MKGIARPLKEPRALDVREASCDPDTLWTVVLDGVIIGAGVSNREADSVAITLRAMPGPKSWAIHRAKRALNDRKRPRWHKFPTPRPTTRWPCSATERTEILTALHNKGTYTETDRP